MEPDPNLLDGDFQFDDEILDLLSEDLDLDLDVVSGYGVVTTCFDTSSELTDDRRDSSLRSAAFEKGGAAPSPPKSQSTSQPMKKKKKLVRKYSVLHQEAEEEEEAGRRARTISNKSFQPTPEETTLIKADTSVPRPIIEHVRTVYPQMLVKSVNSGDLANIQNYFNTFMTGPCTFVANHNMSPRHGIPEVLAAFSPQLLSHYLLGCYATFPDMVLKLGESRAFTHAGHMRIEMDLQVFATKLYDIPEFLWAPDIDQLSNMFQSLGVASTNTLPALLNTATAGSSSTSSGTSSGGSNNSGKGKIPAEGASKSYSVLIPSPDRVAALKRLPPIPKSYVAAVLDGATVLPVPIPMHNKGVITLYLDEHNSMQHITIDLTEQRSVTGKGRGAK